MRIVATCAALCLISTAAMAQTTTATFAFVDSALNIDLTGSLQGTLSGDYFTISAFSNLSFNGSPVALNPIYFESADAYFGAGSGYNGNGTPVVTLDGSYMDWMLLGSIPGSVGFDGFYFAVNDIASGGGGNRYSAGPSFGAQFVSFAASDWSLNVPSVPEPSSLALAAVGIVALAAARRRVRAG